MNYTIYAGQHLIYNKNIVDENGNLQYVVLDPMLSEQCDGFSSLTYRCIRGSQAYDFSEEIKTRIKVYKDGTLYWQGRILDVTKNIRNQKNVYVEDLLGMLNDAIYDPFKFQGTVTEFLNNVVGSYNASVSASQQFVSIVCDVDEGNIVRSSDTYATCWNVLKTKLLDMIGGVMWVSYNADGEPILNYSKNPRRISTQHIEFGKNLKDYAVKWSYDKFYTACIPLGHRDDETREFLTIESVNGGKNYLIDTVAAQQYGVIFAPVSETTWDNVTIALNLFQRGTEWMQNNSSRAVQEISLTGLDMSTLGVDVSSIDWLDAVVVSTADFEDTFVLKTVRRKLDDLASVEITMGDTRTTLTSSSAGRESQTAQRIENIESNYVSSGEAVLIAQEEIENSTIIDQKAEAIVLSAMENYVLQSEYEAFKGETNTELSIQSGQITANYNSVSASIVNLNESMIQQFTHIESFIKLLGKIEEGGVVVQEEGIVIGESSSEIKVKLENDTLYFFKGDEAVVTNPIAWFSQNQLFVDNSTINNLTLGQTGAYLDARIVGSGDNICVLWSGRM